MKVWLNARTAYFSSLCTETCLAALPAVTDVDLRYDMAKVSATGTSQIPCFSACLDVLVRPSGRFSSELFKLASSLIKKNMPARQRS